MKRLFIVALLTLLSCKQAVKDATKPIKYSGHEETYKVVNIDGCQYIIFYGWYSNANTMIVHKGNCNNPIHKTNNLTPPRMSVGIKKKEDENTKTVRKERIRSA